VRIGLDKFVNFEKKLVAGFELVVLELEVGEGSGLVDIGLYVVITGLFGVDSWSLGLTLF